MAADDLLLRIAAAFDPAGVRTVRSEVQSLGRFVEGLDPELDVETGDALRNLSSLEKALDGIPDETVDLNLDASDAAADVASTRSDLAGIPDETVGLRVDADTTGATAEVQSVRTALQSIPDAQAQVTANTADALADVSGLRTALAGIPDEEVSIRLDPPNVSDTVGSAIGDLSAEVGGLGLASGVSEGLVGGLVARTGALKGVAAGLVAVPILAWLGGATTGAAELADSVNATNVVFGEARGLLDAFARTSVESVGLSERSFRNLAAPIGGLLSSLGFLGEEQASLSIDAIKLGSDFASVYGGDIPSAVAAVGGAFRGETEPIRAYGISLDEASVKAEAARLGLVQLSVDSREVAGAQLAVEKAAKASAAATKEHGAKSLEAREASHRLQEAQAALAKALEGDSTELDKNQKARATWSLITSQAGNVAGDFARTSEEGVNATRVASAALEDASDKAATAFVPIMVTVANVVTAIATAFTSLPQPIQTGIVGLVTLVSVIAGVAGVVKLMGLAFSGVGAGLVGFVTGPVGLVLLAVAAVAGIVYLVIRNWETITGFFSALWEGVSGIFGAAVGWLGDHAGTIARVVLGILTLGLSELVLLFARNWETISGIFGAAVGWLGDHAGTIARVVLAILTGGLSELVGLFVRNWDSIRSTVAGAVSGVIETVTGLPGRILGALGNMGSLLLSAGADLVRGFVNGIRNMAGVVIDALLSLLPGPLRKFAGVLGLNSPSRLFRKYGRWTGEGYALGIVEAMGAVDEAMALLAHAGPGLAPVAGLGRPGASVASRAATSDGSRGPTTIVVNPSAGMDEAELARKVALEQAWADRGRG